MNPSTDRSTIIDLLSHDTFTNLVTLKMLSLYPDACSSYLYRDGPDWACRTELNAAASQWDRKSYPNVDTVVLLDGNSPSLLPAVISHSQMQNVVFKVHDDWSRQYFRSSSAYQHAMSLLSYSTVPDDSETYLVNYDSVERHTVYSESVAEFFEYNGYAEAEIEYHLSRGGRWFSLRDAGQIVSVCIVFPNFRNVWEIGAVYTDPDFRNRGFGRKVTEAALAFLVQNGHTPRYQFRHDNHASRALAESLNLKRKLTVEHFLFQATS